MVKKISKIILRTIVNKAMKIKKKLRMNKI